MANGEPHGSRQRVFLSYSRKDRHFVGRLAASLTDEGFTVDWDQDSTDEDHVDRGISAEDEWWERLEQMISAADVVVFVVSPDAAASKVCGDEIRYAFELGKRRIPVECRPIDFATAPPALSALNVKISFVDDFERPLRALVRALSVDVGWHRHHTWLLQEALRWNEAERPDELLCAGADLRRAERCAARRPSDVPELADVVVAFIETSQRREDELRAIETLQRQRFIEVQQVTQELLAEELRVRESARRSTHDGVAAEQDTEIARIRALVETADRWHPESPNHVASLGADDGYAEVFEFPCCGLAVTDHSATSDRDAPSQLRGDGCQEIPRATQYAAARPSNPFASWLVRKYRELQAASPESETPQR